VDSSRRNFLRVSIVAGSSLLGPGAFSNARDALKMSQLSRFQITISDSKLRQIRLRVSDAEMPARSRGAGWRYGVDQSWFKGLVDYWAADFDWRNAEAQLNQFTHFRVDVSGRAVHFVRLSPPGGSQAKPIPLMLLHGWPYTFATMLPLAERVAAAGFEVIVPSLPGVAFSEAPDDQIRGLRFISKRLDDLMVQVLGHSRYLIHGGDHGAVVADWIALDQPGHVAGIHANMIAFRHAGAGYGSGQTGVSDPRPEETAYAKAEVENMDRESAYFRLQLTRPETITYALSDSPVGWAAYMLDKWQKWTDTRNKPFESIYGRDRLLTEVMLFLVTESVATSIWPYAGFALEPFGLEPGQTIKVPFGYSSFNDPLLPRIPRSFVERSRTDIRFWREHEDGGHFPMLEQTQALADDLVAFSEKLS
jgi:pimeloyl-ACP methyl ester carboxylesterase